MKRTQVHNGGYAHILRLGIHIVFSPPSLAALSSNIARPDYSFRLWWLRQMQFYTVMTILSSKDQRIIEDMMTRYRVGCAYNLLEKWMIVQPFIHHGAWMVRSVVAALVVSLA